MGSMKHSVDLDLVSALRLGQDWVVYPPPARFPIPGMAKYYDLISIKPHFMCVIRYSNFVEVLDTAHVSVLGDSRKVAGYVYRRRSLIARRRSLHDDNECGAIE